MDMPFFIWKNENSMDNNVTVKKLPPIIMASTRIEKIPIPGRNGFLTVDDGSYEEIIKPVQCYIKDDADIDYICNWLRGSGDVVFSNQPDRKYKAVIINQIPFNKVLNSAKSFIVQFECQPFAYSLNSSLITLTQSGTINNPSSDSLPYIKVYGTGNITLTINNKNIIFTNVSSYIELDSEMQECFKGTQPANNQMSGVFPILVKGNNSISWTGTVTKIEITPRWGWI